MAQFLRPMVVSISSFSRIWTCPLSRRPPRPVPTPSCARRDRPCPVAASSAMLRPARSPVCRVPVQDAPADHPAGSRGPFEHGRRRALQRHGLSAALSLVVGDAQGTAARAQARSRLPPLPYAAAQQPDPGLRVLRPGSCRVDGIRSRALAFRSIPAPSAIRPGPDGSGRAAGARIRLSRERRTALPIDKAPARGSRAP